MACVKDFIPFSVTSNCTSYGPLLIDLIYHQATFQPRYKDLMRRYFSYPLNESKSDIVYVGWDAIAEDTNLKCGQFRHKRQSLEQSTIQSQIVDTMNQELTHHTPVTTVVVFQMCPLYSQHRLYSSPNIKGFYVIYFCFGNSRGVLYFELWGMMS